MNKYVVVVLLLVVSVLSGLSQASITNGDFSALDGDSNPTLDPAWTHNDYVTNEGGYAHFREHYVDDKMSTLSQGIDIAVGDQLSFNYTFSSYPVIGGPVGSDTFYVYLGGIEIFSINNDSLAPVGGIISETKLIDVSSFAGSSVELKFVLFSNDDLPDTDYDTTVDLRNVDVTSTVVIAPVPSAMLLGGLGVASVSWLRRRRIL